MPFFIGDNATRKERIMKTDVKFISYVIMILCVVLVIATVPTEREGAIYKDTVRLHILANSDSDEDQKLKLSVRDKLLEKYGEMLAESESKAAAEDRLAELESEMECDVNEWIREGGGEYECEVRLGVEWYDTREYEDFTLPCGYYTSARILLGEGDGKNWWCVMYPPLCLDMAIEDAPEDDAILGYTDEEVRLITKQGYNVKFKILELISESVAFSSKNS